MVPATLHGDAALPAFSFSAPPAYAPLSGADWRVPRSRGFEGMAMTPDGTMLWAMLEGAILDAEGNAEDGTVRVLAFDPEARDWTGASFRFHFTEGASAIGTSTATTGRGRW